MKRVKIITNCPICESLLERVKDQLFCRNTECGATKSKKLLHFIKTMKIKGLGEKTVEKLDIADIPDIYDMSEQYIVAEMGEKIGKKIFNEIELSKVTSLSKFITAFGIPLVGNTAGRKLEAVSKDIDSITFEVCKSSGLGDKASESFITWKNNEYQRMRILPMNIVSSSTPKPKEAGIRVCLTGKLGNYSRGEATALLESKGITVVSGVSKLLDFLVNEDGKQSSKLSKAESLGIPTISLVNILKEIK
tara:strand:+ start:135 stop:881 length:747 start_codon:yes stop_codon:yes gene_type:complete